jgi:hypothetical protein
MLSPVRVMRTLAAAAHLAAIDNGQSRHLHFAGHMPHAFRMKTRLLFIFLLLFSAFPAAAAKCPSLLDHRYTTLQGGTVNLCDFPMIEKTYRPDPGEWQADLKTRRPKR